MKILFVSSSFHGGGISAYALEVINCFKAEHDISVIIGDDSRSPLTGVKVYHYETKNTSFDNACKILNLIVNDIKPDVIINSFGIVIPLIIPYLPDNIKVISVSHSLRYNEADVAGINAKYADHVIALSNYNAQYLKKTFHIESSKISVLYNCVEDVLKADTSSIEQKKKNTPLNIVYVGGTTAAKSPEIVFHVMKELSKTEASFKFYFMGVKTPTLSKVQPFKSLSDLYSFDSRFVFTGRIPREEAMKIMREANIFLIPSRREGCPMALLEAMRYGTIVITSDFHNACSEMITNDENGLVIPHNKLSAFKDTILDIVNNHEKYYNLYNNCYHSYLNNYSVPVWQSRMNEIINHSVLTHKKRKSKIEKMSYMLDLMRMRFRFRYNKLHIFFNEELRAARYFAKEYYRNK